MKKHKRPNSVLHAKACVPPGVPCPNIIEVQLSSSDRRFLLCDTIAAAVHMEAAFWLELQFCFAQKSSTRHWYQHNLQEMIQLLKEESR